jgi:hypothetical protein
MDVTSVLPVVGALIAVGLGLLLGQSRPAPVPVKVKSPNSRR